MAGPDPDLAALGLDSSSTLVDLWRRAAWQHPSAVAVADERGELSYAETWSAAQALAEDLAARALEGERVALILRNGAEFGVGLLGCLLAGATPALMNPLYPAPQIASLLDVCGAKALLLSEPPNRDTAAMAEVRGCAVVVVDRSALLRREPRSLHRGVGADDVAAILFTGGTTGVPKGVAHTHRSLVAGVRMIEPIWPTTGTDDRWLTVAPMSHIWGLLLGALHPVAAMGRSVIAPRFQPDLIIDMIGRHGITAFTGGPAQIYAALLGADSFPRRDFGRLRVCATGGSPTPVHVIERWREATGLTLSIGYGMSEIAPIAGSNGRLGERQGSVGRAAKGVTVEVVDAEAGDRRLPPGETGEIRVKGPPGMLGYLHATGRDDIPHDRRGWIHTGDLGWIDDEGFLFINDRKKDLIMVKGFNVYPRLVEEALVAHAAVSAVGVVGRPDERDGERIVAFVARRAPVTAEELRVHVASLLARYMAPTTFHFLPDVPTTAVGKVDRKALRALAADLEADA